MRLSVIRAFVKDSGQSTSLFSVAGKLILLSKKLVRDAVSHPLADRGVAVA